MSSMQFALIKYLIPFQVRATAPRANLHRRVLEEFPHLIDMHFNSLRALPVDVAPRRALAAAFQKLLDPSVLQRDVRSAYYEAEGIARRTLFDFETKWGQRQDPYVRLILCELVAVATYYSMLFGVDGDGSLETKASILLRAYATAEIYKDIVFATLSNEYESIDRTALIPYREGALNEEDARKAKEAVLNQMPQQLQVYIKEMLLWERALFGKFRFDRRGEVHNVVHRIKLVDDVGHDEMSSLLLYDPLLEAYGNITTARQKIKNGRWYEYCVTCNHEDHLVSSEVPPLLELPEGEVSGSSDRSFFVHFNQPLCPRFDVELLLTMQDRPFEIKFETAIMDDSNNTFFEKFFLRLW